jgi:hypothetical protein
MGTLDIIMLLFLIAVVIGGMIGFFIHNNKN